MAGITVAKAGSIGLGGTTVIGATGYGAYSLIQPTNIEEKLKWDGKDVLPADTGKDDRKSDWEILVKKYERENNGNKITGLTLTAPTDGNQDRTSNINELKKKCKELLGTKLDDADKDNKYTKAEKWCCAEPKTAGS